MTGDEKEDNPGHITTALCKAQREVLRNEIKGLKDDVKTIDSRTWQILAGIGVTILLTIMSIFMK